MEHFFTNILHTLNAVAPFVIALTILVFIHEYGHFWVARRNGIRVDVFSIGFGPELFGWTDKHGTRWRVSPIPLGGYVRFAGDADASSSTADTAAIASMTAEEKAACLVNKTPLQRIAVSFAGPAANYLFAVIVLAIIVMGRGVPTYTIAVGELLPGQNGEKAGLHVGDVLTEINGTEIRTQRDMLTQLSKHAGEDVQLKIARPKANAETETLTIAAQMYTMKDGVKENAKLGVSVSQKVSGFEAASPVKAVGYAVNYCVSLSWEMLQSIGRMLTGNAEGLGGIGSIGVMAKSSMNAGLVDFCMFLIVLSINLGLVNLLPVPVLDGGSIMLSSIEMIRGKPLSEKVQENIFKVGLALVLSLMLYTTGSDVMRYKDDVWAKVVKLF
jgi:regulator of sigma E protease